MYQNLPPVVESPSNKPSAELNAQHMFSLLDKCQAANLCGRCEVTPRPRLDSVYPVEPADLRFRFDEVAAGRSDFCVPKRCGVQDSWCKVFGSLDNRVCSAALVVVSRPHLPAHSMLWGSYADADR